MLIDSELNLVQICVEHCQVQTCAAGSSVKDPIHLVGYNKLFFSQTAHIYGFCWTDAV